MLEQRKGECVEAFNAEAKSPSKTHKYASPISLRLNRFEREQLERDAGDRTLSAYIRERLFGKHIGPFQPRRPKRKRHSPTPDHVILAQVLGKLGESRLASNLNQIAKAANIGALPVTDELMFELHAACANVQEIRDEIIKALGKAPA